MGDTQNTTQGNGQTPGSVAPETPVTPPPAPSAPGGAGVPAPTSGPPPINLAPISVAHPNFFAPIATLMGSIPAALEGQAPTGGAPRYVRIARLRQFMKPVSEQDEKLASVMATGVGYFIKGMAYVMKYSLKLHDLLIQGDAGKALVETALQLAHTVTQKSFLDTIEDLNTNLLEGPRLDLANTMRPVGTSIDLVEKYIGFIPEPRDLDVIGQQLYSMMVIEWVSAPTGDAAKKAETTAVDMAKTGKLRLMLWALNKPFEPLDPGVSPDVTGIMALGQRRLWQTATGNLPARSTGAWTAPEPGSVPEPIFDTDFTKAPVNTDIVELQRLLKVYGYPLDGAADGTFDAATQKGVAQFQWINGLRTNGKVTGEVDLPTVNQLFHLRYDPDQAKGGLRRAKRFNDHDLADFPTS
jgi:hypothetical protein